MNVSIFGLGYVGATLAGCLARSGHTIWGVDPAYADATALLNSRAVRNETDLRDYIESGLASDRLAIGSAANAIEQTQVTFVCVGTPPDQLDGIELAQLEIALGDIGRALREKDKGGPARVPHLVVVRSTVFPGTTRTRLTPILERESGRRVNDRDGSLTLLFQPEFLREGSACSDFFAPPFTVLGWANGIDLVALDLLKPVYVDVDGVWLPMTLEGAEMLKLVCNTWHALKVAFANEIGAVCRAHHVNGAEVMDVFVHDTKLNLSPAYLRPGFAFGGPCLPKDLAALLALARRVPNLPLLSSLPASNVEHLERIIGELASQYPLAKRVGVVGLAHKPGTGDLRGSPAVMLVNRLRRNGYAVWGYDESVTPTDYPLAQASLAELAAQVDVLIVTHEYYAPAARAQGRPVIEAMR